MLIVKRGQDESDFTPGQFVRIHTSSDPLFSSSHPYTVASNPKDPEATIFYLSGNSDVSRNLARAGNDDVRVTVEGYYGPTDRVATIEDLVERGCKVVVVAGG